MHTGRVFSKCSYETVGQILQQKEMEKDLGVIIKDSLSFLAQVVEVRNKDLRMRGYIKRNVRGETGEVGHQMSRFTHPFWQAVIIKI